MFFLYNFEVYARERKHRKHRKQSSSRAIPFLLSKHEVIQILSLYYVEGVFGNEIAVGFVDQLQCSDVVLMRNSWLRHYYESEVSYCLKTTNSEGFCHKGFQTVLVIPFEDALLALLLFVLDYHLLQLVLLK